MQNFSHPSGNIGIQRVAFRETSQLKTLGPPRSLLSQGKDKPRPVDSHMTALLGLLAIAGYRNRDKIAEVIGSLGKGKDAPGALGGSAETSH